MSGIYSVLGCIILLIFIITVNYKSGGDVKRVLKIIIFWVVVISLIFVVCYLCGIFTFGEEGNVDENVDWENVIKI